MANRKRSNRKITVGEQSLLLIPADGRCYYDDGRPNGGRCYAKEDPTGHSWIVATATGHHILGELNDWGGKDRWGFQAIDRNFKPADRERGYPLVSMITSGPTIQATLERVLGW